MKRIILTFMIWSIYLHNKNRAAFLRCDVSLQSVREGVHCPANQIEWEEKSIKMNCEGFQQNCTEKNNYVYHCLINPWGNGTIEVCAPVVLIAGHFCAEFNKGGARVQTQYRSKCNTCPIIYKSSEIFKYQECYKVQKTYEMSTNQQITENVSLKNMSNSQGGENRNDIETTDAEDKPVKLILGIAFGFLFLLSLAAFCIIRQIYKRNVFSRKKENPGSLEEKINLHNLLSTQKIPTENQKIKDEKLNETMM